MRFMAEESPMVQAVAPFDGSILVTVGDFMYLETDDIRPFSSMTDQTTLILNQARGSRLFMGIAKDYRAVADTGAVSDFPIVTDAVVEYPCSSATFEIGDMVAPVEDAGGTYLENQKVVKTTDPSLAIGVVTKRYASATTTVRFRLMSRVLRHSPTAEEFVVSTVIMPHASQTVYNLITAQEALQVVGIDLVPDLAQGGALTGTISKATGTATPAAATTPISTAAALNFNGAAHTNQQIAITGAAADQLLAPGERVGLILSAALTTGIGTVTIRYRRL